MKHILKFCALCLIITAATIHPVAAEDVYQTPETFVLESFEGKASKEKRLEITLPLLSKVQKIMGTHYHLDHVTYWEADGKTVWILEEIGKFKPITTGFLVGKDNRLERVKVLIYRESHGWEVKRNFFTRQFKGAGLKREKKLDKRIDGISGATLSVNTLKKLSALALMLHTQVSSAP